MTIPKQGSAGEKLCKHLSIAPKTRYEIDRNFGALSRRIITCVLNEEVLKGNLEFDGTTYTASPSIRIHYADYKAPVIKRNPNLVEKRTAPEFKPMAVIVRDERLRPDWYSKSGKAV
jgi:hypothetical protein